MELSTPQFQVQEPPLYTTDIHKIEIKRKSVGVWNIF